MAFTLLVGTAALLAAGSGVLLWRLAPAGAATRRRHGAVGFDEELRPAPRPAPPLDENEVAWDDWEPTFVDPWHRAVRVATLVVVTIVGAAAVALLLFALGRLALQVLLHYVPPAGE